jgi:peptidyl-Lys metalloendopeptidase
MKQRIFATTMIIILVALAIFFIAGGASASPRNQAMVNLTSAQASFTAGEPVTVQVTITNPGKHPIKILKWFVPSIEADGNLFQVSQNGVDATYLGVLAKRPKPETNDYIHLKAGESLSSQVDLALLYDLSSTGTYSVRYFVGSAGDGQVLVSNDLLLWVEGRPAVSAPAITPQVVTGTTGFNKCSIAQQSDLLAARTASSNYSANAFAYLTTNTKGPRYTTWFGGLEATRYNTVMTHFIAIKGAMDNAAVTFDCGCKKKYYAYVYPNQPYKIYLCQVFWSAPMTGTDSKAGTLIHEMSHFNNVASTNDYVYGQAGAKNLAITDPVRAINNADNHEYFAENNPAQN